MTISCWRLAPHREEVGLLPDSCRPPTGGAHNMPVAAMLRHE